MYQSIRVISMRSQNHSRHQEISAAKVHSNSAPRQEHCTQEAQERKQHDHQEEPERTSGMVFLMIIS
jgi:hypothetical protein